VKFTSFVAEPNRLVPVAVLVDHDRPSVIVTCRGTLSLEDLVTDASARPVRFGDHAPHSTNTTQQEEDALVHSGMLAVAIELFGMVLSPVVEAIKSFDNEDPPQLFVTGHSLGAGVAALLTVLFRRNGGLEARCFAFSPPGALVGPCLARAMQPYCYSFIVGDDLVPRLGLKQLYELRDNVIRVVANATCHKRRAISSFFITHPEPSQYFLPPDAPLKTEADSLADACISHLVADQELLAALIPPGQCFHIVTMVNQALRKESVLSSCFRVFCYLIPCRSESAFMNTSNTIHSQRHNHLSDCCCCLCFCDHWHRRRRRVATLATEPNFFSTLRIARRMFLDHMPWVVHDAIRNAAADAPFVSTEIQHLLLDETIGESSVPESSFLNSAALSPITTTTTTQQQASPIILATEAETTTMVETTS